MDKTVLVVAISGHVIGVDARTGDKLWTNPLQDGGSGEVALASAGDRIFAAAVTAPRVFCLRYPTGETIWSINTTASGRAGLIVQGDRLLVARGGRVDCYDFEGRWQWTQPLKGLGHGSIAMGFPDNWVQADRADTVRGGFSLFR